MKKNEHLLDVTTECKEVWAILIRQQFKLEEGNTLETPCL